MYHMQYGHMLLISYIASHVAFHILGDHHGTRLGRQDPFLNAASFLSQVPGNWGNGLAQLWKTRRIIHLTGT